MIIPSFYIGDGCARLERITQSLDRYVHGKAEINLELTMFNYNDIINNFKSAFLELRNCANYLEINIPFDYFNIAVFDILMKDYDTLHRDPNAKLEDYIDFAHNIIKNLKCGADYDGQYKIYGYGDYFSEITAPNEILMCNILDDVLKKSKNIPLNILNINCWDGRVEKALMASRDCSNVSFYGIMYKGTTYSSTYRDNLKKAIVTDFGDDTYRVSQNAFNITIADCFYETTTPDNTTNFIEKPELKIIKRAVKYTQSNGIVAFTIYKSRLHKDVVSFIVKNLDNISIYNDLVYARNTDFRGRPTAYSDCVVIVGTKKEKPTREYNVDLYNLIRESAFNDENYITDPYEYDITGFLNLVDEVKIFCGAEIDEEEAYLSYKNSSSYKDFQKMQNVQKISDKAQKSLLPFNVGQLGIILTSGCLDGRIDEGGNYCHAIKGRIIKEENVEIALDNINHLKETHKTYNNKVEINIFLPNGEFKRLA